MVFRNTFCSCYSVKKKTKKQPTNPVDAAVAQLLMTLHVQTNMDGSRWLPVQHTPPGTEEGFALPAQPSVGDKCASPRNV